MTLGSSSAIFATISLYWAAALVSLLALGAIHSANFVWSVYRKAVLTFRREMPSKQEYGVTVILPFAKRRQILTYPAQLSICNMASRLGLSPQRAALSSLFFFLLRALRPALPELFIQMKRAGLTTSLDTNDDPENLWRMTLRPC